MPLADQLTELCNTNSGTTHQPGVERVAQLAVAALTPLADTVERVPLETWRDLADDGSTRSTPVAPAVVARRRLDAPVQVLLSIHLDTVYPADHPFQTVEALDGDVLRGPGVADAKGGLVVILEGLRRFEATRADGGRVGWTVVLNPDEEVGSPASTPLLHAEAGRATVGLVFEPAVDGGVIRTRKGSGYWTFIVRGRSAHAGRDIDAGRNAVAAACRLGAALHALHGKLPDTTLNVGRITGGGAVNAVPGLAVLRINVRVATGAAVDAVTRAIDAAVAEQHRDGITVETHGHFAGPPLTLTPQRETLLSHLGAVFADHGLAFTTRDTGGASDANKLAAVGLPVLDGLGPRGGALHSPDEFVHTDSLGERASLLADLLAGLDTARFAAPTRSPDGPRL